MERTVHSSCRRPVASRLAENQASSPGRRGPSPRLPTSLRSAGPGGLLPILTPGAPLPDFPVAAPPRMRVLVRGGLRGPLLSQALVTIPATRRQLERPRTGDRLRQCEGPHVVRAVRPRSTRRHAGPRGRRARRRRPGAGGHAVRQASSDADAGRQVSVGGEQTRCFRPGRKTLLGEAFLGGPAARPKRRPGRVRPRPAALPAARPPARLRPGPAQPSLLHPQPGPPQAPFISTDPRCGEQSDLGNDPQIQSQ